MTVGRQFAETVNGAGRPGRVGHGEACRATGQVLRGRSLESCHGVRRGQRCSPARSPCISQTPLLGQFQSLEIHGILRVLVSLADEFPSTWLCQDNGMCRNLIVFYRSLLAGTVILQNDHRRAARRQK